MRPLVNILVIVLLLTSCSASQYGISKRKHRKGFHFSIQKPSNIASASAEIKREIQFLPTQDKKTIHKEKQVIVEQAIQEVEPCPIEKLPFVFEDSLAKDSTFSWQEKEVEETHQQYEERRDTERRARAAHTLSLLSLPSYLVSLPYLLLGKALTPFFWPISLYGGVLLFFGISLFIGYLGSITIGTIWSVQAKRKLEKNNPERKHAKKAFWLTFIAILFGLLGALTYLPNVF